MSIRFHPDSFLRRIAPKKKIEKLLSKAVSLKRTALSFVDNIDFIDKKDVATVALKAIKGYKKRIKDDPSIKSDILDDPKQLIQRVQNEIVFQIQTQIKDKYEGKKAKWLPSDAHEPRPEHQLNYGKTYFIGEGINGVEPGDLPGCRCGVEILVPETKLEL